MISIDDRITSKAQLKETLEYELPKYHVRGYEYFFQVQERAILKKHQITLRKAEYYRNTGSKLLGLFYHIRLLKIQNKYSVHIPLNTCKKGLHIMHLGSILINANAIIGRDCSLHINTAIVAGGHNSDSPILGDGVVVGVGAVILGGVRIANNVAIGANAVVNKDIIEDNIAVAGVPAKKISNNGRDSWGKQKS